MRIIGIDPGRMTGMMMVDVHPLKPLRPLAQATHRPNKVVEVLDFFARGDDGTIGADVWVVVEKYVPREGVHGKDTTAMTINGSIAEWAREKQVTNMMWQLPNERAFVTPSVLRRLQLWLPGHDNRHINDASRHVVAALVKYNHYPTMKMGWSK